MDIRISHNRDEESIEAKTRWFRSLSISERMEMLCSFTDLVLSLNPGIMDKRDAQQAKKCVQILSRV